MSTKTPTRQLLKKVSALQAIMQRNASAKATRKRLIDAGIDPAKASKAADKAARFGALCMATTKKGFPCIALGSGNGGRCKYHGGNSTGPRTEDGKRRSLEALARGREKALRNRKK